MKRSGAATVGTLVALNFGIDRANAAIWELKIASINISADFNFSESQEEGTDDSPPPNNASFYQMKCIAPEAGERAAGMDNKNKISSAPAGWAEIIISAPGETEVKKWHRIFVQTLVISQKIKDNGWYNLIQIGFVLKARWAAVPCANSQHLVAAPKGRAPGGLGGFGKWYQYTRTAWVKCNATNGEIKSGIKSIGDNFVFNDSTKLNMELETGDGLVKCKGKLTTLWGVAGEFETGFTQFESAIRPNQ